jgi:arylsulfatase
VGSDEGTPVTEVYTVPFTFTGTIAKVTIELQSVQRRPKPTPEDEKRRKEAAEKAGDRR